MAHYAFLDKDFKVVEVIVGRDESNFDWEQFYANERGMLCKRTSYGTVAGSHINGGQPFRKNFAGIGYTYDLQRDAFISPKPYESWILDEDTCCWEAPEPYPNDGGDYKWSEFSKTWIINKE